MAKYIGIEGSIVIDGTLYLDTDQGWKTHDHDNGGFQDVTRVQYSKYGEQLEAYHQMINSDEFQQKRKAEWEKYWDNPSEYFKNKKEKKYSDEFIID